MTQTSTEHNPFMLMLNPEVVIAAMQSSERLSGLNRHLCRPLDRPSTGSRKSAVVEADDQDIDDDSSDSEA